MTHAQFIQQQAATALHLEVPQIDTIAALDILEALIPLFPSNDAVRNALSTAYASIETSIDNAMKVAH